MVQTPTPLFWYGPNPMWKDKDAEMFNPGLILITTGPAASTSGYAANNSATNMEDRKKPLSFPAQKTLSEGGFRTSSSNRVLETQVATQFFFI